MTNHCCSQRPNDPEDIKRRDFIKGLFAMFTGALTVFLSWPFISFLLPVTSSSKKDSFVKVPNFPAVPVGVPSKMTFEDMHEQAFIKTNTVYDIWVIKHSETEATVYSPLCPHLNCRFTWLNNEFNCPCHGSLFNTEGKVQGGPSPRSLDTLPYKIEGGELYVQWKLYKAGIPEKVEA